MKQYFFLTLTLAIMLTPQVFSNVAAFITTQEHQQKNQFNHM